MIGLIFVVERVVTVWAVGPRGRLLAAPIVIELAYVLVLQVIFVTSLVQIATGRTRRLELRPPPGDVVTAAQVLAQGILLPSEVLYSGWFQALALFVAVNTLVFAALALVKLVPKRRFRAADAVRRARDSS